MPLTFYPHEDELNTSSIPERLESLMEAAERFKGVILDLAAKQTEGATNGQNKRTTPRDIEHAFNWEEITRTLKDIREMPESTPADKANKANALAKLAEIYETLRAAKMPKLDAVRIALMSEVSQLKGTTRV